MTRDEDRRDDDALFARLDRLTEALTKRFDAVDARLDGLERDTAEILGFLIALRASLDGLGGDLADDDGDPAIPETSLH